MVAILAAPALPQPCRNWLGAPVPCAGAAPALLQPEITSASYKLDLQNGGAQANQLFVKNGKPRARALASIWHKTEHGAGRKMGVGRNTGQGAGQCPAPSVGQSCAGSVSNCWSPGLPDTGTACQLGQYRQCNVQTAGGRGSVAMMAVPTPVSSPPPIPPPLQQLRQQLQQPLQQPPLLLPHLPPELLFPPLPPPPLCPPPPVGTRTAIWVLGTPLASRTRQRAKMLNCG